MGRRGIGGGLARRLRLRVAVHGSREPRRYAHQVIALSQGRVHSAGPPEEVVTADLLREVFGVEAEIVPDPRTGVPLCIPYGLHRGGRASRAGRPR